jgi:phospholipid transport system substrate-binding protein
MKTTTQTLLKPVYFLVFSLLLGFASPSFANDLSAPQKIIEELSNKLKDKLKNPEFGKDPQRVTEFVKREVFPHVDAYRMSALVLGKHWRTATKEQKQKFTYEFRDLQVRTYASAFSTQFKEWSVNFLPSKLKEGAKKTKIKTQILQQGKPPVNVDYYMAFRKEKWKVYDIKIEGISMVITNRNTISDMIRRNGSLDAVIAEISKKNKASTKLNS